MAVDGNWFEKTGPTSKSPLVLRGRLLGRSGGSDVYETNTIGDLGIPYNLQDHLPLAPQVQVDMTSRTSATITIVEVAQDYPRGPITSWEIYRAQDGGDASLVVVLDDSITTYTDSGLPTSTPEITFQYTVFAVNADGRRSANVVSIQWAGTIVNQPTAPTNFAFSNLTATSVRFTWSETTDTSVTKHALMQGNTILVNDLGATATSYVWSGRSPGTVYNNISIRRYNGWPGGTVPGFSPSSNTVSFTTPLVASGSQFLGHVPGHVYLGWSTSHTEGSGAGTADTQLNTQTPLPANVPSGGYSNLLGVRRLYNKDNTVISFADSQQRVMWLSAKGDDFGVGLGPSGWAQVASGAADAGIVSYFTSLVARNKLTIFTFHHEPVGDAGDPVADGTTYCNAMKRIKQVVNSNFGGQYTTGNTGGHKIIFCPNYEENRLRNLRVGGNLIDWSRWLPLEMMPHQNSYSFDFISWDMYQYNADTSTNARAGVQFSHRWWRIDELFTGAFTPQGTTQMTYMNYTPGQDIIFGIGEGTQRPGAFYTQQQGGTGSNMTGAKYTRDYLDYVFAHPDKFAFVSWFNTIGADKTYNDERLWPDTNTWGGDVPNHPSFLQQTGDTEYTINIYREKLASGLTVKLAANGLPPG